VRCLDDIRVDLSRSANRIHPLRLTFPFRFKLFHGLQMRCMIQFSNDHHSECLARGFREIYSRTEGTLFESQVNRKDPRLVAALNGEPGRRLRGFVRGAFLRASGTFFTGTRISSNAGCCSRRLLLG